MDVEGDVRTIRKSDSSLEGAVTTGKSDYSAQMFPHPNLNTFSPNMELLANMNETKHTSNSIF